MQDLVMLGDFLREISFGVLIAGLFYTFGMFFIGKLFAAFGEHGHDIDHDVDHDIDHDYDVDHGEIDHDIDHDYEVSHELDHDYGVEHGEVDHDMDHDYGTSHEMEHDVDHDVTHDLDHDFELAHEYDVDRSGFFELKAGPPLGVTIGTTLVTFGFLGSLIYYEGIVMPLALKLLIHLGGVLVLVMLVRAILGNVLVESGFLITPRHLVGRKVEAVSTIHDEFGEVRTDTEMGLRRFNARPFQKGAIFRRGTTLYVVSADDKFVFVDPRKEAVKWLQEQSKAPEDDTE
ncbi:MAG: hypothetical protein DRP09_05645 [Candidatus Thorarchaeota archaeon]|nr:MAG: hypothetical protein DRP09_05645 [Candidatus Thorarchaeota archaeon]